MSLGELVQVEVLHAEWFPLKYGRHFFESIRDGGVFSLACRVGRQRQIVGLVTACVGNLHDLPDGRNMSVHIGGMSGVFVYIMTLGVIDEFRNKGIARILLESAICDISNSHPESKGVYLHVAEYNTAAMRLYQGIGFQNMFKEENFYKIQGKNYAGNCLLKFINMESGRVTRDHCRSECKWWKWWWS